MSKIEIEVTDNNDFNDGWLRYLLGMDRPAGERDEDGRPNAAQNGWDMGLDTPQVKMIRHVFTRQNDIDHPQYIVREVLPDKVMAVKHPAKVTITTEEGS